MDLGDAAAAGQLNRSAAEVYEAFFVPALFGDWPPVVADAAQIAPGQRVLDVACGTGVLAREAARRVGSDGSVTGVDRNSDMLSVARKASPDIDWHEGMGEALPFEDGSFDAVVCQFGVMFFEDRAAAIREMHRVLKPGGRLAVAVWAALETSPGYAAMVALLERLFGSEPADALRAPFNMGDRTVLEGLATGVPLDDVRIETHGGTARFVSIDAWVTTDVRGWTLADMIDDAQFDLLLSEARQALAEFVALDGTVAFAAPAHMLSAVKRP